MNELTLPTGAASREQLLALQEAMSRELQNPDSEIVQPIDCPVEHFFAPYMYGRRIFMPAGTDDRPHIVIGKIHKEAHLNNISMGRVRVVTEFGSQEYVAPCEFVSLPGTKRAVQILEDCVWTTYHHNPTNTQDLAQLEREIIAESFEEYDALTYTDIKGFIQ